MIDGSHIPAFAPGTSLGPDSESGPEHQQWLLQTADGPIRPNDIAIEVLRLVNGHRPVDTIVDLLAQRYEAPRERIHADVLAILDKLAGRKALSFREPARWKVSLSMLTLWLRLKLGKRRRG